MRLEVTGEKKSILGGKNYMKSKIPKILSVGLALVLALSLSLVMATPALAQAGTLTPNSGPVGTIFTISGTGFTPNISGDVWFDTNGNGVKDAGEPQLVVNTNAAGVIVGTPQLGVPAGAAGVENVEFDIPAGGTTELTVTFGVTTPALTLTPNNGRPGTVVTVTETGTGFAPNTAGVVWFDTDSDGVLDAGEPAVAVTTTVTGTLPAGVTLIVPLVPDANYPVQGDIPAGGAIEAFTNFNVDPAITLTPANGPPGTVIAVTGAGFAATQLGWVFFDTNNDTVRDPTEPQVGLSTTATGAIPAGITLTAPSVGAGAVRPVQADLPAGAGIEASANFTEATPAITLTPNTGIPGTLVTVAGTGFALNTAGFVWFDIANLGVRDAGEPQVAVTTTATGTIPAGITLNIPAITAALLPVQADIPTGGAIIEATANFTVTVGITLTPNTGAIGTPFTVAGGGFAAAAVGSVWFDTDSDGVFDAGEPSVAVTTDANGSIPAGVSLTVPSVAAGARPVQADLPAGGGIEAFANFTVSGTVIAVTPTSGPAGTVITITGTNFLPSAAGFVWFDIANLGVRDAGEPQVAVTTTAAGAIPAGTTLTIPTVAAGVYPVQADIPTGGAIEAFANFTVTTAPPSPEPAWVTTIINKIDAIEAKLDMHGTFYTFVDNWFTTIKGYVQVINWADITAIKAEINNTDHGLAAIKTAIDAIGVGGGGVQSASATGVGLLRNASSEIIPVGTEAFWGQLTVQSTYAGYNIEVWDGNSWAPVVPSGTVAHSVALSGFGLRILNDTFYTITVDYVFVYHSAP
jgi:hypothetical protein